MDYLDIIKEGPTAAIAIILVVGLVKYMPKMIEAMEKIATANVALTSEVKECRADVKENRETIKEVKEISEENGRKIASVENEVKDCNKAIKSLSAKTLTKIQEAQ